ncbi:MAG: shikimate kinase [Candidatus Sulfotelmatobacter sp.]
MVKFISENAPITNNKENLNSESGVLEVGQIAGIDLSGRGPDMTSRRPQKMHAIILVGFMGAGKSTVGRALAERLGWTFEDLDDRIELREKQTVAEIFGNAGEAEFRRAEHEALKELLAGLRSGSGKVIAFGGGAFVQQSNINLLDAANLPTVFLDASVEELLARCRRQSETQAVERPLLGTPDHFRQLYENRRSHYLRARFRQDTEGKKVQEIVTNLIQALGLPGSGELDNAGDQEKMK